MSNSFVVFTFIAKVSSCFHFKSMWYFFLYFFCKTFLRFVLTCPSSLSSLFVSSNKCLFLSPALPVNPAPEPVKVSLKIWKKTGAKKGKNERYLFFQRPLKSSLFSMTYSLLYSPNNDGAKVKYNDCNISRAFITRQQGVNVVLSRCNGLCQCSYKASIHGYFRKGFASLFGGVSGRAVIFN